ncbi:hypothetical protein BC332_03651 [Capsicum chinense]|uniref:VQ domain-containing protein n=1 Tax=Capsicum annuum TaxID=4072 RepID=A0A1U8FRQ0_CAPAN|nr:putative esterase KAI2-like [Capsicum annuum]KAF3618891.1 putative esterase KAI2-like [Capsicum annuum]PHT89438.1 hypothetical protein T459_04551 [Capsicum annuum]PHU25319.1 hypothetical protein BC332_03651 [Capsicum chinense]
MESHSHKIYSSSFSSSSSSLASHDQHEEKKEKPYLSTLHGVRSLPSKSITKKPIAPSSPIPPKIYRVEAVNFRQVVQMLTAAPEFQSHSNFTSGFQRTQEVLDPPPLDLSSTSLSSNNINTGGQWGEYLPPSSSKSSVVISTEASNESIIEADERHVEPQILPDSTIFAACSTSGFPPSPSSFAWCSDPLLF